MNLAPRHRSKLQRTMTLGSQLINVWVFDGSEDETVSGRAWREGVLEGNPAWAYRRKCIDRVFRVLPLIGEDDHCRKSHQVDIANVAPFCELIKGAV